MQDEGGTLLRDSDPQFSAQEEMHHAAQPVKRAQTDAADWDEWMESKYQSSRSTLQKGRDEFLIICFQNLFPVVFMSSELFVFFFFGALLKGCLSETRPQQRPGGDLAALQQADQPAHFGLRFQSSKTGT